MANAKFESFFEVLCSETVYNYADTEIIASIEKSKKFGSLSLAIQKRQLGKTFWPKLYLSPAQAEAVISTLPEAFIELKRLQQSEKKTGEDTVDGNIIGIVASNVPALCNIGRTVIDATVNECFRQGEWHEQQGMGRLDRANEPDYIGHPNSRSANSSKDQKAAQAAIKRGRGRPIGSYGQRKTGSAVGEGAANTTSAREEAGVPAKSRKVDRAEPPSNGDDSDTCIV